MVVGGASLALPRPSRWGRAACPDRRGQQVAGLPEHRGGQAEQVAVGRRGPVQVRVPVGGVGDQRRCTTRAAERRWPVPGRPWPGRSAGTACWRTRSSARCLAAWQVWVSAVVAVPRTDASRWAASARADPAAAARSRSPGDGGESSSTATVETTEASHQPASRSGIMPTVPGVATDSTKGSSAAVTPEAALGPATPAKKIAERHRDRDQYGQPGDPADRRADDQPEAADHGQPEVRDDLVPPAAAERGEDQAREPAERGEQGHLQVAEALVGQREQGGNHEDRAQRRAARPAPTRRATRRDRTRGSPAGTAGGGPRQAARKAQIGHLPSLGIAANASTRDASAPQSGRRSLADAARRPAPRGNVKRCLATSRTARGVLHPHAAPRGESAREPVRVKS